MKQTIKTQKIKINIPKHVNKNEQKNTKDNTQTTITNEQRTHIQRNITT